MHWRWRLVLVLWKTQLQEANITAVQHGISADHRRSESRGLPLTSLDFLPLTLISTWCQLPFSHDRRTDMIRRVSPCYKQRFSMLCERNGDIMWHNHIHTVSQITLWKSYQQTLRVVGYLFLSCFCHFSFVIWFLHFLSFLFCGVIFLSFVKSFFRHLLSHFLSFVKLFFVIFLSLFCRFLVVFYFLALFISLSFSHKDQASGEGGKPGLGSAKKWQTMTPGLGNAKKMTPSLGNAKKMQKKNVS